MKAQYIISVCIAYLLVREIYWRLGRIFGYSHPYDYRLWLLIPWRQIHAYIVMPARDWWDEAFRLRDGGEGGFTPIPDVLTMVLKPGYVPLGRPRFIGFTLSQYLGAPSERYRILVAGSRSGKTIYLAFDLLLRTGPALAVDPKLQLTDIAARSLKARGKNVQVMAPYDGAKLPEGITPASWNLFAEARRFEERHGHDAVPGFFLKAAAFMITSFSSDPFWPGASRMMIFGFALHLYSTEPKTCTLARLYQLLMQGDDSRVEVDGEPADPFDLLLAKMKFNTAFGNTIPDIAAVIIRAAAGKTIASVSLTIAEQLKWLGDPLVAQTLMRHDFYMEDLKTGKDELQLFIGMPSSDAKGSLAPYIKLLVSMGLYLMERTPPRKAKKRTAFIVDEVSVSIEAIGQASSTLSGYGVELILATQGIQQLATTYPNEWKELLGNADFVLWMGLNDPESPKVLMAMLGTKRFKRRIRAGWFTKAHDRVEEVERPVMDVDQIRRYLKPKTNRMLITRFAGRALKVTNVAYYRNVPLWLYDADPDWPESWSRAWLRSFLLRRNGKNNATNANGVNGGAAGENQAAPAV